MSAKVATPLIRRGRRVPELDGLRFVLVVAILFTHAGIGEGGWPAVDMFFMMSGFLIAGLLLDDVWRDRPLSTFLSRRVRRLLPAFLACVMIVSGLLMLGVVSVTGPPEQPLRQGFWSVLYVANWYELSSGAGYWAQFVRSPFGHLWSLSIEEQFYLFFPLIMIAIRRFTLSTKTWMLAGLTVLSGVWAITLALTGSTIDRIYYGTDTRAFALLLGATAALLTARPGVGDWLGQRRRPVTWIGSGAFVALLVINATVQGGSPGLYRGGLQATSVLECLVVVSLAVGNPWMSPILRSAPLVWLGERSYSIYLWHMPVFALMPGVQGHPWRILLIGTPIAIGIGALSYECIERAFLAGAPRRIAGAGRDGQRQIGLSRSMLSVALVLALSAGGLAWASVEAARPHTTLELDQPAPVLDGAALAASNGSTNAFASATPTTIPSVKALMVLGDSMAVTFANTLQIPGMEIINNGQIGCGSINADENLLDGAWQKRNPGCRTWRDVTWLKPLPRADASLWMWGAWDLSDVRVNGKVYKVGTPEYRTFLEGELQRAADQLTADGKRLFITSALCFEDARIRDMYDRATTQNEILRNFASTHDRVDYLPLIDFLCDGPTAIKVNGEEPRPDGVHFSPETSVLVWSWLMPYLRGTRVADNSVAGAGTTGRIDQTPKN